ncbi:unnamed protein product, partial [Rhizoctonia solani]
MDPHCSDDSAIASVVNTISGAMSCDDILAQLSDHGCKNVTDQLDPTKCSQYPVAGGSFGDVFSGSLQGGDPIAIKCLRIMVGVDDTEGRRQLRRAAHEIYVWSKCNHPNVLELIGIAQYQNRIAMVSPWMEQGNLSWFLSRHPDADRYAMCAQIADGVGHLHSSGIIHGDIKPAPEILQEETKLTAEGDVYALGMTILEAITGTIPYAELAEPVVLTRILTGARPTRHEQHFPHDDEQASILWELLMSCWESDPLERPIPTEIANKLRVISLGIQNDNINEAMSTGLSSTHAPAVLGMLAHNLEASSTNPEVTLGESHTPTTHQPDESQIMPSTATAQPTAAIRRTRFTSRAARGIFHDIASTTAARTLMNEWHRSVWNDRPLGWDFENEGSSHEPCWRATPIIMDEPHPEYQGLGRTRREAQNESATKIMNSDFRIASTLITLDRGSAVKDHWILRTLARWAVAWAIKIG